MSEQIMVSASVLDFLTEIHSKREDTEERSKALFRHAFDNAYRDMSIHTIAYTEEYKSYLTGDSATNKKNKERVKNSIFSYVCKSFGLSGVDSDWDEKLVRKFGNSEKEFNSWHKSMCDNLTKICDNADKVTLKDKNGDCSVELGKIICHVDKKIKSVFTYGQAQKIVNMMLKYLYIYDQCDGRDSFQNVIRFFHVPLDSFVLKEIYNRFKREDNQRKTNFKEEKYNVIRWSKIESYEEYMNCQRSIKKFLHDDNAFMWELENWPFEK